jgi:hypothetical protein
MMRALDVGQLHWSVSDLDPAKCPIGVQLGADGPEIRLLLYP